MIYVVSPYIINSLQHLIINTHHIDGLITTIVTWVLSIGFVVGVVVIDLLHNPLKHPKKYCRFRTINWLICGLTYAFAYMGRYNISVANLESIWNYYNCTTGYGTIILVGNIAYAIFVITNGYIVDIVGAKMGMCIGALGSGVTNLLMGVVASVPSLYNGEMDLAYGTPVNDGSVFVGLMSTLYAINNFFQTFCTSSICKLGVNWYAMTERGVFSGLFGVVISFGFFLAFQVDGLILGGGDPQHLPWIFFTPAMVLTVFFFLNFFIVAALPEEHFPASMLVTLRPKGFKLNLNEKRPNLLKVLKPIFSQWVFLILFVCELCIGWDRDGVLNWYHAYFVDHFNLSNNSVQYQIAATGVTVGGMFGSFITGVLSDVIFNSRRPPMALVDSWCLMISLVGLYFCYESTYGSAVMIFIAAIFFNGINGIITSTAAMDFAGSEATGTAVGLLDGVQKIASACTGSVMSWIVATFDYRGWILSMIPTACVSIILFAIIVHVVPAGYKSRKEKRAMAKETEKEKLLNGEETGTDESLSDSTLSEGAKEVERN